MSQSAEEIPGFRFRGRKLYIEQFNDGADAKRVKEDCIVLNKILKVMYKMVMDGELRKHGLNQGLFKSPGGIVIPNQSLN